LVKKEHLHQNCLISTLFKKYLAELKTYIGVIDMKNEERKGRRRAPPKPRTCIESYEKVGFCAIGKGGKYE
jgi:hypothetical protein